MKLKNQTNKKATHWVAFKFEQNEITSFVRC